MTTTKPICCEAAPSTDKPHPICDWVGRLIESMPAEATKGNNVRQVGRRTIASLAKEGEENFSLNLMRGSPEFAENEKESQGKLEDFFTRDLVSFVFDRNASEDVRHMRMLAMADTLIYLMDPSVNIRGFAKYRCLSYLENPEGNILQEGHKHKSLVDGFIENPNTKEASNFFFTEDNMDRQLYAFILGSINKLSTETYPSNDFKNYFNSVMNLLNSVRDTKLDKQAK